MFHWQSVWGQLRRAAPCPPAHLQDTQQSNSGRSALANTVFICLICARRSHCLLCCNSSARSLRSAPRGCKQPTSAYAVGANC